MIERPELDRSPLGGSDTWDNGAAGEILTAEYFESGDSSVPVNVSDTASLTLTEVLEFYKELGLTDTASISVSDVAELLISDSKDVTDTASLAVSESASVEAVSQDEQYSGGFIAAYWYWQERKRKRQKDLEEAEQEAEQIQDEIDRQIAVLLKKQEAEDDRRAEMSRLQKLVGQYADRQAEEALSDRVMWAMQRVLQKQTVEALQRLEEEIERQLQEEEAVLLLILNQ